MAKTKALISFAVTAKLICAFVFAYSDCWFSHASAQMIFLRKVKLTDYILIFNFILSDSCPFEFKIRENSRNVVICYYIIYLRYVNLAGVVVLLCHFSLICSLLLKDLSFAITAAGVVSCGGPKMSPRTPSIVQIIFSFWSFEISWGILRNQKNIMGLDSFTNVYIFGSIWIILVLVSAHHYYCH